MVYNNTINRPLGFIYRFLDNEIFSLSKKIKLFYLRRKNEEIQMAYYWDICFDFIYSNYLKYFSKINKFNG